MLGSYFNCNKLYLTEPHINAAVGAAWDFNQNPEMECNFHYNT